VDARASGRHHLKLRARFWHRSRLSVPDAGCLATAKCRRLQTFGTSRISPRFCEPLRMRHVIAVWDGCRRRHATRDNGGSGAPKTGAVCLVIFKTVAESRRCAVPNVNRLMAISPEMAQGRRSLGDPVLSRLRRRPALA
jgi:hypothetical protein